MDRRELIDDQETGITMALDGRQSVLWTALPCIVTEVNYERMIIKAQPAVQGKVLQEDGRLLDVDMPYLIDVPIVFPSAGGFILTLPIKKDDEVLVIFSSRCIDAWWQNGGFKNKQLELRMHDLSDGFAIPGPRSIPNVVTSINPSSAQLRNNAGDTLIEIGPSGTVTLKAPSQINITAPAVQITGALNVSGAIVGGSVATEGGIDLDTHTHVAGGLPDGLLTGSAPGMPVTGATGAPQ